MKIIYFCKELYKMCSMRIHVAVSIYTTYIFPERLMVHKTLGWSLDFIFHTWIVLTICMNALEEGNKWRHISRLSLDGLRETTSRIYW